MPPPYPTPLFIAHSLNNGDEPTATLEKNLAKEDKTPFFNELTDVLVYCDIPAIEWVLQHERCKRLLQNLTDTSVVLDMMIAVLKRPDCAAVLVLLCYTHHCKQLLLNGAFYQTSNARSQLVTLILGDDNVVAIIPNFFAAMQCRAPIVAIESQPCRSGERRWNIVKSLMRKMKEAGGCRDASKTEKWIRCLAVCFSYAWASTTYTDNLAMIRIVALAFSAPASVKLEASMILDKCAKHITSCSDHCVMTAASRMCTPRKLTGALVRRFVSKVENHCEGYHQHLELGKCPMFRTSLQFFSAQKPQCPIRSKDLKDVQELLDIDFRGGDIGKETSMDDRTYTFVGFLIKASKAKPVKLPEIGQGNFQTIAFMVMCHTINAYLGHGMRRSQFWQHDIWWEMLGVLRKILIAGGPQGALESMTDKIATRNTTPFPGASDAMILNLQQHEWFNDNPANLCFWGDVRRATSEEWRNPKARDALVEIEIAARFAIPMEVKLLKNKRAASRMLLNQDTRNRIFCFLCAIAKVHGAIPSNRDVVDIIVSMYFSTLFTSLGAPTA
jgi:hypothetical protein